MFKIQLLQTLNTKTQNFEHKELKFVGRFKVVKS